MKRARATRLALVNWKGLVYEEVELDPGVTALEGENGAGKTTVMIAAYTVLLPDLSHLRFTNVGETGSTGGDAGIYGRLGHAGPAYAWLDLQLDRKRVVAGVLLDRKARPRLEVSPYLLDDVPFEVPLETLVMRRHGGQVEVPEAPDIPNLALAAGARPRSFGKDKKAYFSALFELGITPLRMASSEERKKLDDMLRTCMMGGISNVLRTGLRDFLFAENTRLADTVKRMEHNLALCRDTRARVRRSEELRREIGELYEKGESTFLYAAHGVAVWEREARERLRELESAQTALQDQVDRVGGELAQTERRLAEGASEQEALGERLDVANLRVQQVERALELLDRARAKGREVERLGETWRAAQGELDTATAGLRISEGAEQRAREEATTAAENLSSHQDAYQELSRRVGLHRAAVERLERARTVLGLPALPEGELQIRLESTRREEARLRDRFREIELRVEDAEEHAGRHANGLATLSRLLRREAEVTDLPTAWELRDKLRQASTQLPRLEEEATSAARTAGEQRRARERAAALGVPDGPHLSATLQGLEATEQELDARLGLDLVKQAETRVEQARLDQELARTRAALPAWLRARDLLDRLAERWGPFDSSEGLASGHSELKRTLAAHQETLAERRADVAALTERIRGLELQADHPEHVLRARDAVDAEIVAEHFDEVALERAATVQAWLGQRAHALLVDNPRQAALRLSTAGILGQGDEVLLVRGLPSLPEALSTTDTGGVVVTDGQVTRLAQPPEIPVLGRAARARALAALQRDLARAEAAEETQAAEVDRLTADLSMIEQALPLAPSLDEPDPRPQIDRLALELSELGLRSADISAALEGHSSNLDEVRLRLRRLRELLPTLSLLDPPDYTALARAVQARHGIALTDAKRWESSQADWRLLADHRDDLRRPPIDEEQARSLRDELDAVSTQRKRLRDATEALGELCRDPAPLGWGDSEAILVERAALTPKLKASSDRAREALAEAVTAMADARQERDNAQERRDQAKVRHDLAAGESAQLQEQLEETGLPLPRPSLLTEARATREDLRAQRETLARTLAILQEAKGGLKRDLDRAQNDLRQTTERVAGAQLEHRNRRTTWETFAESAASAGLQLDPLLRRPVQVEGSPNLFSEAKARCAAITALLRHTESNELLGLYEGIGDGTRVEHVRAWSALRAELHRRIPPDISEAPDVVGRLDDLGRRLHRLRRTLKERERDLRTDARHIGTTIQSQRRRAYSLVRSLAKSLEAVRFGTITRITLSHEPIRKMDELLDALSGQVDLFSQPRPVEEVMVELFESIGGGRVRAARLLDYRQYFRVRVDAVRDDGSHVGARGDQMSTGEAIGIGASVMMVVLQAWEQHSAKLRKKRQHGTMRLLFLDEATRLSPKSLLVLFDLCSKLDLQLLIAAPEVARVAGGTTYTLVRHKDRVDFHGRRVVRHGLGE